MHSAKKLFSFVVLFFIYDNPWLIKKAELSYTTTKRYFTLSMIMSSFNLFHMQIMCQDDIKHWHLFNDVFDCNGKLD